MQRIATVLLAIAVPGVPVHAEQLQLVLDPSATTVSFVLRVAKQVTVSVDAVGSLEPTQAVEDS